MTRSRAPQAHRTASSAARQCLRLLASVVALVGLVLAAASPAGSLSAGPVLALDFPDPAVLVDGGVTWAYSTGAYYRNLQVSSSTDLAMWTTPAEAMPKLAKWASPGLTWAPSVIRRGATYVMYYTARSTKLGAQCIGVAVASSPAGPFVDSSSNPFLCQQRLGGSIDPQVFAAPNGALYLHWKSDDNALGRPTQLWGQQLSGDGRSLVGSAKLLLKQSAPWQAPTVEGPAMIANGGSYYLFYGANDWASAGAAIGYATCSGPLGPCTDRSLAGPWLASHDGGWGPSGPAPFVDAAGVTRLAYHQWIGAVGYVEGARAMWLDRLDFVGGRPVLG